MRIKIGAPSATELLQLKKESKRFSFCIQYDHGELEFYSEKITRIDVEDDGTVTFAIRNEQSWYYSSHLLFWSDQEDYASLFISELLKNDNCIKSFNHLKNKFERINSNHFDEFQKRDPEEFFFENIKKILLLVDIMGESAFKWMSDQLAQTVLPLERLLNAIPEKLPPKFVEFLNNFFKRNQVEIMGSISSLADWKGIIVCISALLRIKYKPSEIDALLLKFNFFSGNARMFSLSLSKDLLDLLCDTLGLSIEERDQIDWQKIIEIIPLDQFAPLINLSMGSNVIDVVLNQLIVRYIMKNPIHDLLHNSEQELPIGKALGEHNAAIKAILTEKGFNLESALYYKKTYEFSYMPLEFETIYESTRAAKMLHVMLPSLQEKAEKAKNHALEVKQKNQFDSIINQLNKLLKIDLDKLYEQQNIGILNLIKKNIDALWQNEAIRINPACQEFWNIAEKFKKQFEHAVTVKETVLTASKKSANNSPHHFRIEQWDKEKISTIFLGNEVDCCMAVGSNRFYAMIHRIIDDAMLFHVVVDLQTQKPIALTWLYLAIDQSGDVNLVANFIEIKARYGLNEKVREVIINALMYYSGEIYCKDNPNIKVFVIDELTYGLNKGKIPFKKLPIALAHKVGGAFAPDVPTEELALSGKKLTYDRYSLNSLRRMIDVPTADFHIYDPRQLTSEQREKFSSVEKRIDQIVRKHLKSQKEINPDISNEKLLEVVKPIVEEEVYGKMGAFFDKVHPEKLSSILGCIYHAVIQDSGVCQSVTSGPGLFSSTGRPSSALISEDRKPKL